MRDIKFWDKYNKQMLLMVIEDDQVHINAFSSHYAYINIGITFAALSGEDPDPQRWSDLIELRPTGLRDKNDDEIYEGDILKGMAYFTTEDGTFKTEMCKEVRWDNDYGRFYAYKEPEEGVELPSQGLFQDMGFRDNWNNCEIIGNIYENPELLK